MKKLRIADYGLLTGCLLFAAYCLLAWVASGQTPRSAGVAPASSDALTVEESKKLDALTETWNRLRAPIEDLERKPEVQRYLALVQLRAELQRDLEDFAQKAVLERKYKPGEAFLDLNARRVVKKEAQPGVAVPQK